MDMEKERHSFYLDCKENIGYILLNRKENIAYIWSFIMLHVNENYQRDNLNGWKNPTSRNKR